MKINQTLVEKLVLLKTSEELFILTLKEIYIWVNHEQLTCKEVVAAIAFAFECTECTAQVWYARNKHLFYDPNLNLNEIELRIIKPKTKKSTKH